MRSIQLAASPFLLIICRGGSLESMFTLLTGIEISQPLIQKLPTSNSCKYLTVEIANTY